MSDKIVNYSCRTCSSKFQKKDLSDCPKCGSQKLKRHFQKYEYKAIRTQSSTMSQVAAVNENLNNLPEDDWELEEMLVEDGTTVGLVFKREY